MRNSNVSLAFFNELAIGDEIPNPDTGGWVKVARLQKAGGVIVVTTKGGDEFTMDEWATTVVTSSW